MKFYRLLFLIFSLAEADNKNANNSFGQANNLFTPPIYKQIAKISGNICVSPLSAELVLTLLYFGCKGSTADQLRSGLFLPNNTRKIECAVKSLFPKLIDSENHTFDLANRIYVQKDYSIRKEFEKISIKVFKAETENLDFGESAQAAATINKWVEEETNGTIKDLIGPKDLKFSTRVVLVNALHFKANWTLPFLKSETRKASFFKTPTNIIQVDTMYLSRENFNYYESQSPNAQFLEMSFENGASMVFALPRQRDGLAALEKKAEQVFASIPFESTRVDVALPKFKFDYTTDFGQVLPDASWSIFLADADLSGISGNKGDLVVNKVIQKAFIDLNEGGVEAAAATYVEGVGGASVPINSPIVISFIADHPFIFAIKKNNVIIFAGRITEPKY